jgi:hypothetical protein
MRLKLDRLVTGTKGKMLQTNRGIFVCNVESDFENFDVVTGSLDNRFGLWDDTKNVLLKNIYNINDFSRLSPIHTTNGDGVDFLDVHAVNSPYSSVVQFNNVAVGLASLTDKGITYQRYNNTDNIKEYVDSKNTVIVYPPSGVIEEDELNLEPLWILSGVEFNFMDESPVEFEYYDYTTGVMYSNSMNMKNMYNNQWDVGSNIVTGVSLSATSGTLDGTRYYMDINADGDSLIYDVYRNQNNYEALSTELNIKRDKHLNVNPYFQEWNPESTTLCGWTTSTGVSSFIDVYSSDPTHGTKFSLFSSVVLDSNEYIVDQSAVLPSGNYLVNIEVSDIDFVGSIVVGGTFSMEITAPGTYDLVWSTSAGAYFAVSATAGSYAIINNAICTDQYTGTLNVTNTGVKDGSFEDWTFASDSQDDFYKIPTEWTVSATNGFIKRDGVTSEAKSRLVFSPELSSYIEIADAPSLSSTEKTYAILVKMPSDPPQGTHNTLIGGSNIGSLGYYNDNIAIKGYDPSGLWPTVEDYTLVWRGGAPLTGTVYANERNWAIPENKFDGRYHWFVLRKSGDTDIKYFDMEGVSTLSAASNRTPTYNTWVGRTLIGGGAAHPNGTSQIDVARFYSWNYVLNDGQVSGIITNSNVPLGYTVGYTFDTSGTPVKNNTGVYIDGVDDQVKWDTTIETANIQIGTYFVEYEFPDGYNGYTNNWANSDYVEMIAGRKPSVSWSDYSNGGIADIAVWTKMSSDNNEWAVGGRAGLYPNDFSISLPNFHEGIGDKKRIKMAVSIDVSTGVLTSARACVNDFDAFNCNKNTGGSTGNVNLYPAVLGRCYINGSIQGYGKFDAFNLAFMDRFATDFEMENYCKNGVLPQNLLLNVDFSEGEGTVAGDSAISNDGTIDVGAGAISAFWDQHDGDVISTGDHDPWTKRFRVAEPKGKAWMYAPVGETTSMGQLSAFDEAGLYDVYCSVYDHAGGTLSLYCGTDKIMDINSNGVHRATYTKDSLGFDTGSQPLVLQLSGATGGNITVDRVNVTKLDGPAMAYDYAERIDGVYKYQNVPKHKSNLFSIRISNSNLNDSYFGGDKDKIQKSINNIIRKIIDKITPIHTQLFNITWTKD